jgi:hypothetical protein
MIHNTPTFSIEWPFCLVHFFLRLQQKSEELLLLPSLKNPSLLCFSSCTTDDGLV